MLRLANSLGLGYLATPSSARGARERRTQSCGGRVCARGPWPNRSCPRDRRPSIAGQQHALVCLDSSGLPLRPAIPWDDDRSASDAESLVEAFGGPATCAARIGLVPTAALTASKWAWIRRCEPHLAAATTALRLPHDYLTERLTRQGVTDRGDASGTGWWSSETES
jgi:sugar (pentulose or hexulose) kinase